MNLNSILDSAEYADIVLRECYGWLPDNAEIVYNLIVATSRLFASTELDSFDMRLIGDCKYARLACDWNVFIGNTYLLKLDFPRLTELQFLRYQLSLMQNLEKRENIYSLPFVRERLEDKAKANITKYIVYLNAEIKNSTVSVF